MAKFEDALPHQTACEAGLALLRALGVQDTDLIVSFTLHFHCHEWPTLTIVRHPTDCGLAATLDYKDSEALAAARTLAPAVRIVEEVEAP